MKNITVSVDSETYQRARVRAAEQGTSVSALVRDFLIRLSRDETEAERLRREERAIRAQIKVFRGGERVSRDEAHERNA
jgi:plasmid stability protein